MFNIYLLIVCVCVPMCHSPHVEAWGQLAGESLLFYSVGSSNQTQLCGKLPHLLSHLSGCHSFTTQSRSFLLCSVIPFILTVGLQWRSHCGVKWLHLKPCLPLSFQKHLIFSSGLMETVSTISSSAEQWCPVASTLSTPIVPPKKDCRCGGARQACCCFSLQSAGLEPSAFLLVSECDFSIPPHFDSFSS